MNQFKVGFSEVNINPPLGIEILGYFIPRVAKGFLDDLKVTTIIMQLGGKKIALICVDTCMIGAANYSKYVEYAEKNTGISGRAPGAEALPHGHRRRFAASVPRGDRGPA